MIKDLVFIGSEAEGYYSGAYECEGVFISREMFEKYSELLEDTFNGRYFHELDGKHSEVKGDQITIEVNNENDLFGIIFDKEANYATYVLEDHIEDAEDDCDDLIAHVKEIYALIQKAKEKYAQYTFALTEEEHAEVTAFISKLREGR